MAALKHLEIKIKPSISLTKNRTTEEVDHKSVSN